MAFLIRYWKVGAALAALIATFVAGAAINGWRYQAEIAQLQEEYAEAAAGAMARLRRIEAESQIRVDAVGTEHAKKIERLESDLRGARAAGNRLRDELATANGRAAPNTSPAKPVDDPFVLRELLVSLDHAAGVLAAEADHCSIRLRDLQLYVEAITR